MFFFVFLLMNYNMQSCRNFRSVTQSLLLIFIWMKLDFLLKYNR